MPTFASQIKINLFPSRFVKEFKPKSLKDISPISIRLLIALMICSFHGWTQGNKVPNLRKFDYAPYHFGFVLAVNQMYFTIKTIDDMNSHLFEKDYIPEDNSLENVESAYVDSISSQHYFGFTIGIVSNLRMGEYFDLRFVPSLAFGERDLKYKIYSNPQDTIDMKKPIPSYLVELPLHIKYKALRIQNSRIYIIGGIKYTLDLAQYSRKAEDTDDDKKVKLDKNDLMAEAGVGCDFYTAYFKLGIELKMSYGFNNIIVQEHNLLTNSIESLKSKMFQLSFTFE